MEKATIWAHIHAERAALAATLADLDPADWAHDTLCPGWTVHDVAAHVISTPQIGWTQMPAMMARNLGRGYNTMIYREVKRLGARETRESILGDFERFATSTHHVPTTTSVEPLIDALLHHQDIARPLSRTRTMAPEAAAVAADRVRRLAPLMGTGRLVRSVRMAATDIDWARGTGPTVSGPVQELLMLASGRAPDPDLVSGEGLALVAR
ncbi:maleylpyruvate isomerase family mycothiol-dependent enzyme [Nocardioides daeguensis]|uniref:Maleylpyruvate isomerase family mycothiol-dependent enzyme n=1 Tax=Nocardioides daeguensis TaxID=908359 RepID=A0ABP6V497_9ACTN|nr:maleylpyruvate isomerase family mycothiol-dependent enzyme [Nocardioides daeguensis]MBV6727253.1 maleylpyruvate isomerase family mycothiol-dependent enzyme [Nocardioides daeguensis]MCR1771267.1 maleylpyruvate isomerase family mycothiol-dependent enzyme [Nocardioides daeguensis]